LYVIENHRAYCLLTNNTYIITNSVSLFCTPTKIIIIFLIAQKQSTGVLQFQLYQTLSTHYTVTCTLLHMIWTSVLTAGTYMLPGLIDIPCV